jgi:Flp pilus assembly protein CpaB
MKKNLVPLLGIAFVVAIISTGIFYGLFVGRLKSATSPGAAIVVAARNLDRGATLQPADVKLAPWGSPELPKGAYSSLDKVSGLTVTSPIEQNEAVLETRVASSGSGAGAGLGIAKGMRAVSIHAVDSSGVVSILRPGYKVDVQLVSNQSAELRTILQNIEVLSVNAQGDGRNNTPVVTLLATPEGADMVGLGDSTARLRVVLRNPLDDGAREPGAVTLPSIMSRGAKK